MHTYEYMYIHLCTYCFQKLAICMLQCAQHTYKYLTEIHIQNYVYIFRFVGIRIHIVSKTEYIVFNREFLQKSKTEQSKCFQWTSITYRHVSTIFEEVERFCFCFSKKKIKERGGGTQCYDMKDVSGVLELVHKNKTKKSYFISHNIPIRDVSAIFEESVLCCCRFS